MATLAEAERVYAHMVALRRSIHRHPELAFEEVETARTLMEELDRLGIPYDYMGAGGGIVARLGAGDPKVALRAEMDALPGAENTHLPFTSEVAGKMHACGHDAHMAMVLGAAALLAEQPPPSGTVLLVFQPAEERGGGARVVLRSGLLAGTRAIFAGHVTREYRLGEIMVGDGVITAQSDRLRITVHGRGGHGARPHEATDAAVIASLLVVALQTLISRETNPVHPSVITIGRIEAGSGPNIIADSALLEGSIRTTQAAARAHIHSGLQRMARAFAELHDARIEVTIDAGYPPVVNTPAETELARAAARAVVGLDDLIAMEHPSMGSEDFSYYLEEIPGCYVRLGARRAEHEFTPLHNPAFDVDESVLRVGAAFFDEVARRALAAYRA